MMKVTEQRRPDRDTIEVSRPPRLPDVHTITALPSSCAIDARMKQMQQFFRYWREWVPKRMGRIHYALQAAAAKDIRRI